METLRRFPLPALLIVALPVLYLGAFFGLVAVDSHVLNTWRDHRTGFGPVERLIDETPFGPVLPGVGTERMRLGLYSGHFHRNRRGHWHPLPDPVPRLTSPVRPAPANPIDVPVAAEYI